MEQIIVSLSQNVHAKFGWIFGHSIAITRDGKLTLNYKLVKSLLTLFVGCIASMPIVSCTSFFSQRFFY